MSVDKSSSRQVSVVSSALQNRNAVVLLNLAAELGISSSSTTLDERLAQVPQL